MVVDGQTRVISVQLSLIIMHQLIDRDFSLHEQILLVSGILFTRVNKLELSHVQRVVLLTCLGKLAHPIHMQTCKECIKHEIASVFHQDIQYREKELKIRRVPPF